MGHGIYPLYMTAIAKSKMGNFDTDLIIVANLLGPV